MKNSSLRSVIIFLITLFISGNSFAQLSTADAKAVEKSKGLYAKGKYDKAISTLVAVQSKNVFNSDLWNFRIIYESDRYDAEYTRLYNDIVKQYKAGKTDIKVDDSKLNSYKVEMLFACVQATMYAEDQELASNLLDRYLVTPSVDTAVDDKAKESYDAGDEQYNTQNWNAAIREYKKALEVDSNYFSAAYSIALAYYKNEEYDKAVPWFQRCIRIEPKKSITYRSLADTYMQLKQYDDAKNTCIDGILIYPDVNFFNTLQKIADKLDKKFDRHWQERWTYPNAMNMVQDPMTATPWQYYREAKDRVIDYCDDNGILKKAADGSDQKYMETFSWEFMLKKSQESDETDFPQMAFARKMKDAGYLDCYVFVSMYHYYIHEQYKDFAKNNAQRIRDYINNYLFS
ncbi:MAG TPA: tetratricopeptide repeat protein [Bacteroidia bacterium]|jgi:tetratricopeptide (TPR) repeat protein|nr:tetratricopeptide repeat protein [Bacteroidia bacterium]